MNLTNRTCFECGQTIKHGDGIVGFMNWLWMEDHSLHFPAKEFNILLHNHCFEEVAGGEYYDLILKRTDQLRKQREIIQKKVMEAIKYKQTVIKPTSGLIMRILAKLLG